MQQSREEIYNQGIGKVLSDAEGMGYLDPKEGLNMLIRLSDIVGPVITERDRLSAGLAKLMTKWFEETHVNVSYYDFVQGIARDLYDLRGEGTGAPAATHRRFHLQRDTDVTGVSGSGRVVEGVMFSDGTGAMRWLSDKRTTTVFDSIEDIKAIHGHDGATRVVWDD